MKVEILKCRLKNYPAQLLSWPTMLFQNMYPWDRESYTHMAIKYQGYYSFTRVTDVSKGIVHSRDIDKFLDKYKIIDRCTLKVNTKPWNFESWLQGLEGTNCNHAKIVSRLFKTLARYKILRRNTKRMTPTGLILKIYERFGRMKSNNINGYSLVTTSLFIENNKQVGF